MHPIGCELYLIPVATRLPLKFGSETTTIVTCARAKVTLEDSGGERAAGWGETPLSAAWLWPADLTYSHREKAMARFCRLAGAAYARFGRRGHPLEVGHLFLEECLPGLLADFNRERAPAPPMPWLAALACFSPFDLAAHDAYAIRHGLGVFETLRPPFLAHDLAWFFGGDGEGFAGRHPADYLAPPERLLTAWHLVGGQDWLRAAEADSSRPDDGYPVCLENWIERDGLICLKIKLRGNDFDWDYRRLIEVGAVATERGVRWLAPDFNCTVRETGYVVGMLERLAAERPDIDAMLLYVEQPFPYDLERNRIDVRAVSAMKPLFMDESAHGWRQARLGRELGWTGVALKNCKSLSGALLTLCWARRHGMDIMVQDLTNPMLAQIAHVQLAAHARTFMGVESNGMQFYPDASLPEAEVHPGLFRRRDGRLDLSSLGDVGFGYRVEDIRRALPEPERL